MDPLVNVVIPTYNRGEYLLETLAALAGQTYGNFEVMVVDDGSEKDLSDDVKGLALPYPCDYVRIGHRGRAGARNEGLRRARGEIVLFFDDHSQPHRRLIEEHVGAHLRRPGHGAFRGRIEPVRFFREEAPYLKPRCWREIRRRIHANDPIVEFGTHNLSVKRRAVEKAGPFDERFTNYGAEDQEFGIRIKKAGYRLGYLPRALALYVKVPKEGVETLGRAVESGRNAALLVRKHPEYRGRLGFNMVNRLRFPKSACRRVFAEFQSGRIGERRARNLGTTKFMLYYHSFTSHMDQS